MRQGMQAQAAYQAQVLPSFHPPAPSFPPPVAHILRPHSPLLLLPPEPQRPRSVVLLSEASLQTALMWKIHCIFVEGVVETAPPAASQV
jgi:hypothetical protein